MERRGILRHHSYDVMLGVLIAPLEQACIDQQRGSGFRQRIITPSRAPASPQVSYTALRNLIELKTNLWDLTHPLVSHLLLELLPLPGWTWIGSGNWISNR